MTPAAGALQQFETLDVKANPEVTGKDRQAFASIIGFCYEAVKSWETRRRNPSGAAKRLLTLISVNPAGIVATVSGLEFWLLPIAAAMVTGWLATLVGLALA